jgi:hypothetical protein
LAKGFCGFVVYFKGLAPALFTSVVLGANIGSVVTGLGIGAPSKRVLG